MSRIDDIDREFKLHRLRERLQKEAGVWNSFKDHLVGGLATGAAAAGIAALGSAAGAGISKLKDAIVKGRAMKDMVEANPHLSKKDAKQVKMTFNSLYHMNPDLATDPLVAGSFVTRSLDRVEMGDSGGAYIDPQTAINLSKGQSTHMDPVLQAFVQGASNYKPDRPDKPSKSLADEAKLEQYKARLKKDPEAKFGQPPAKPPAPSPAPTPRQRAEAAFRGKK